MDTHGSHCMSNCIIVSNVPTNVPNIERYLREYFEDSASGGEDPECVQKITVITTRREALVDFTHKQCEYTS